MHLFVCSCKDQGFAGVKLGVSILIEHSKLKRYSYMSNFWCPIKQLRTR
jgi:hypothetical protein